MLFFLKDLRNTKEDSRIEAPMKRAQPNSHNLLFNTASSEPNHRDQENSSDGSLLLCKYNKVISVYKVWKLLFFSLSDPFFLFIKDSYKIESTRSIANYEIGSLGPHIEKRRRISGI